MKVELLHITPNAEEIIEQAGRTAYLSFDKITADSAQKFIHMLVTRGHDSVIEHATATFRISEVSRTMTHQLVRHRLAAYTQQSQRVVDEGKLRNYTTPPDIKNGDITVLKLYDDLMSKAFKIYKILTSRGIRRQDARFVLPNACHTEIVMTCNLRNWRHVIKMRGTIHAQWEIRSVIREILYILQRECPTIFEDLSVYEEDLPEREGIDIFAPLTNAKCAPLSDLHSKDELVLMLAEARSKNGAIIENLIRLQGEAYHPATDKQEISTNLEEIIEEFK